MVKVLDIVLLFSCSINIVTIRPVILSVIILFGDLRSQIASYDVLRLVCMVGFDVREIRDLFGREIFIFGSFKLKN